MARRRSSIRDFAEGFNSGWDIVGEIGAAYDLGQMDDAQVEKDFKVENYAGGLGLDAKGQQAQTLAAQDAEFGADAANMTAEGLNYAAGAPTARTDMTDKGLGTTYSYRGKSYGDAAPSDYMMSYEDEMARAKVFDKWGMRDDAKSARKAAFDYSNQGLINELRNEQILTNRQAREQSAAMHPYQLGKAQFGLAADAQNLAYNAAANPLKLDGLDITNRLNDATLADKNLDIKQKREVQNINNMFGAALNGDMEAVTGNKSLMESIAKFYNNSDFADDDRRMTYDAKSNQWMVVMGSGEADPQVPATVVLSQLQAENPELFRQSIARAHQYAVAGVTGNYDSLYKNDAYTARAAKDRRGTALKAPEILQDRIEKGIATLPEWMRYTKQSDPDLAAQGYATYRASNNALGVKNGSVKPPLSSQNTESTAVPEGGLRTPAENAQFQQQVKADKARGRDLNLYLDAIERAPDYATAYEMLNEPGVAAMLEEYGLLERAQRAVQDRADDGRIMRGIRAITRPLGLRNKYLR
jgi:hypothetical protein